MDRIIGGYLTRFIDEFDLDKKNKDRNFELFCHYSILKNELLYLDDSDLEKVGVGKNKGIDGVCFAIDGNIVTSISEIEDLKDEKRYFNVTIHFIQAKTSVKFKDAEIANFCDTVIDFLNEKPSYTSTKELKEYHNIYLQILSLLSFVKVFKCKLYYCSTGTWNNATTCATTITLKKETIEQKKIFNKCDDLVEIYPIDNEKLRRLYDKANQPLNVEFNFAKRLQLEATPSVTEAYVGVLPFSEFKKIIADTDSGNLKPLFSDNVRDFLGLDEEVNDSINKTLEQKDFFLFQLLNNGITIIAEENRGREEKFNLINSQVINGCQTSNVLFLNKDLDGINDLNVPIKLIITTDPDVRDRIIVSTNNQTSINKEQLLALTSFQKNLEKYYESMDDGLYYERRKSQYSYNLSIKKKQIVDIREQIKSYVAMFLEEPHVVSGYFGKVYRERKDTIFNKDHKYEPYYISGIIQFKFKQYVNSKKIDRKYNKARYHLFMLFRKITEPFEKVDSNDKKIKSYCDAILKILRDDVSCLKSFTNAIELIDTSKINIDDPKEIYKKSTTNALIEEFKKRYK